MSRLWYLEYTLLKLKKNKHTHLSSYKQSFRLVEKKEMVAKLISNLKTEGFS